MNRQRWAVILAGGDGTRLRPLTRLIAGGDRPKQFCKILGAESLLAQTRSRLAGAFALDRTLFTVVERHERFYMQELADVKPSRIVIQPCNKGTTPAIAYSVMRIAGMDPDAVVGIFPTDHFYARETQFLKGVESALDAAEVNSSCIILVGVQPDHADADYGWIEPSCTYNSHKHLFEVNCFWEKPSSQVARMLLKRGCLWNTFVMIGRAATFLELLNTSMPDLAAAFAPAMRHRNIDAERAWAKGCYDQLPPSDFSRQVLQKCSERLLVLQLEDVGWSDLGTPQRVREAMRQIGMTPCWSVATS